MSRSLRIGILQHHFNDSILSSLTCLEESIAHFHMRELEVSDYRSAYHQFCDWLYGWSVSDDSDPVKGRNRIPREILVNQEREIADCQRLMKTFETLTSMSLRHLKVCYTEIESQIPRLGQGLDTMNSHKASKADQQDEEEQEELWKNPPEEKEENRVSSAESRRELRSEQASQIFEMPLGVSNSVANFEFLSVSSGKLEQKVEEAIARTAASTPEEIVEAVSNDRLPSSIFALQRDINHVFEEVDRSIEYTMLAMCSIGALLAFAELLNDRVMFSKATLWAHEISKGFISSTLKSIWDLLKKEIPQKVTLATLRDPLELKILLKMVSCLRHGNNIQPKLRTKKLHQKLTCLNVFFTLVDIHVFPNFAAVHREGLKCAQYSEFDSNLWLTGGNDCIIRITDIRASNKHMCLAQYVGHKSIVTEVHFTHEDSFIVSSSFDRTIKIWNTRTAVADKTLIGHNDAITSCDVTADGRYIVSGSLDNTVKFWDFNTGECITTLKKHSKWVKVVRFSPDGRHLATAGMDRKVYIWDTKLLANSRSPSHSRLLENFQDYILDMVMFKPTLLLTTARDSTVRLIDYVNGHEIHCVSLAPSWACTITLSKSCDYFATGSFDNNINVFKLSDFTRVREIRVFNLGILCVRFPKDLSYVIAGTTEGFMQQIPL